MVTKTAKKGDHTTRQDGFPSQCVENTAGETTKVHELDKSQGLVVEVGILMKDGKDECKELTQLANKAGSKAPKR